MKLEYIIALRYIITKRTLKFVSLISLISVVGLTIGVAALVVVLSVFNGFGSLVTSILVSFDPHLRIEQPTRSEATAYSVLENTLQANPNIAAFSPFVQGKALMVAKSTNRVVMIRGLLENKVNSVSGLQQSIVLGKLKFENARGNGIVLGLALADRMGAVVGDTLSIVSPSGAEMAATQLGLPLIRRVVVEGIYESNNKDYDSFFAFVSLKMAQSLFSVDGFIDGLDVRVRHADDAEKMALRLKEQFNSFRIQTWYDLH
ncbi:MAG: ABC transporter permease, partial [Ignavibacteriales bacterium]|nr:ABC transporter permease [Ignavibacteriales bacterium]